MAEQKYSISDLQKMRAAIAVLLWPRGTFRGPIFGTVPEDEQSHMIEDHLRTYMQNGTSVEELMQAANALKAA
jgi:hypothetical protein